MILADQFIHFRVQRAPAEVAAAGLRLVAQKLLPLQLFSVSDCSSFHELHHKHLSRHPY